MSDAPAVLPSPMAEIHRQRFERELRATVEAIRTLFYGYHKGPRPRAGTRVRRPADGRPAIVLGVTKVHKALAVCEDGSSVGYPWCEELRADGRARASLKEVIDLAVSWARRGEPCAINLLVCHFEGVNGERYRNVLALAWMAVAFYRGSPARDFVDLRAWARELAEELALERLPTEQLPPEVLTALAHDLAGELPPFPQGDPIEAVEQALLYSEDDRAALTEDETHFGDAFSPGEVALDEEDFEVIVLGRSLTDPEPGWVDVLDPDLVEVVPRHLDDLELLGYQEDSDTIETLLWDAAAAGNPRALSHLLTIDQDSSPLAIYRRVLMAGMVFRLYSDRFPAAARQAQKTMLASYKLLPKDLRARATALVPETVNAKSKQTHLPIGRPEMLLEPFLQACEQHAIERRRNAPPPEPELPTEPSPETAPLPAVGDRRLETADVEASPSSDNADTVRGVAEPEPEPYGTPVVASQPDATPESPTAPLNEPPRASDKAISFRPAARPLRFKLTDYALLAMEWSLPATRDAYDVAVVTAMEWLGKRIGLSLPNHWKTGGHEIEQAGVELHVEAARNLFAFRLQHPDTQHATRTWRLEATVLAGPDGTGGMVGLRLSVQDRVELPRPPASLPGLIRAWDQSPGLLVGDALASERRRLSSPADLVAFRRALLDPARDAPVWVLQHGTTFDMPDFLRGLAQTMVVDADAMAAYQASFGPLSTQQIHVFAPRRTQPEQVTLGLPASLASLQDMALGARLRPNIPTFREVREAIRDAAERRATPSPPPPAPPPSDADIPALQAGAPAPAAYASAPGIGSPHEPQDIVLPDRPSRLGYSDMQELLDLAMGEKEEAERELLRAREQIRFLQGRLTVQGTPIAPTPEIIVERRPRTLAELPSWAPRLAPRVLIAEKALRFAARCDHNEVDKIYSTLEALHQLYWPMRWGDDDEARARWLAYLTEHRLRCGPIGAALDTARYAEAYQVKMGGRSIAASLHVQGSSSRDPLRCLRIYFHPDEELRQIVISHLPTHLSNSHT